MTLVTVSQAQDGVTGVNAASINTPINTVVNDYNGNVTDANISPSAAINFSKIAGGSATALGSWQSFTPGFGNFTLGNGAATGSYVQIGKTVIGEVYVACGSSTAFGTNMTITAPVTPNVIYTTTNRFYVVGQSMLQKNGTATYTGSLEFDVATTSGAMIVSVNNTTSTYATDTRTTSTVPFSIGAGDTLSFSFAYQAL